MRTISRGESAIRGGLAQRGAAPAQPVHPRCIALRQGAGAQARQCPNPNSRGSVVPKKRYEDAARDLRRLAPIREHLRAATAAGQAWCAIGPLRGREPRSIGIAAGHRVIPPFGNLMIRAIRLTRCDAAHLMAGRHGAPVLWQGQAGMTKFVCLSVRRRTHPVGILMTGS